MKKLDKQFKSEFNKLNISDEVSDNIMNKIATKYNRRKRNRKVIFSICAILLVISTSVGIGYADEINEFINGVITSRKKMTNSQGDEFELYEIGVRAIKELNYDSKIEAPKCSTISIDAFDGVPDDDKCLKNYTYDELEKELDIKLLKSDLFVNNKLILTRLGRVDGKISYIELQMANVMGNIKKEKPKTMMKIKITISTKYNEYYKEHDEPSRIWMWYAYSEDEIHDYYLKKFNTTAKGMNFLGNHGRVAVLEHDGIVYFFQMSSTGHKSIDPDEEMQQILDSLHY